MSEILGILLSREMTLTEKSVTALPCTCGYLSRAALDPLYPVRLDPAMNEYYLDHTLPSGAVFAMALYHCPMCGGVASESKRDEFFAVVSDEELARIHALIGELRSENDLEKALGPPHMEEPAQDVSALPAELLGRDGAAPIRSITYTSISDSANVQFDIYPDGGVQASIFPKAR